MCWMPTLSTLALLLAEYQKAVKERVKDCSIELDTPIDVPVRVPMSLLGQLEHRRGDCAADEGHCFEVLATLGNRMIHQRLRGFQPIIPKREGISQRYRCPRRR
ncbi:hypothetical protein BKA70DRAFT_1294289 [Coprinopsis sp. MPI-PUGE-AT-0042]|nr:hypothetical protein BKA70DRAFT_1294289 [Coprinopsis sp. MPI-PUGE-AT-0042]